MSYLYFASRDLWQVILLALLFGIWYLFFVEYANYRVDLLRQRLFELRARLFEMAKDQRLFSSSAYCQTRTSINGTIRFAHELSFARLLVLSLLNTGTRRDDLAKRYMRELEQGLKQVPPKVRDAIIKAHVEMHFHMLLHVLRTSIILAPLFILFRPVINALRLATAWREQLMQLSSDSDRWSPIDAEVNIIGQPVAPRERRRLAA